MENRTFQLDKQWNIVHYPAKPTGFGILIIGDERNFVEKNHCFWSQNEGRQALLNTFKKEGYTVFQSNLYGKNWGSRRSIKLARQLYEFMMRNEILNNKIHLLAEGMGALTALRLSTEMPEKIRSLLFINPIFSLKEQLNQEKERKFFYKKLVREIADAYSLDWREVENFISAIDEDFQISQELSVKIIEVLNRNHSVNQTQMIKEIATQWEKAGKNLSVCYILPEKKQQLMKSILHFFKSCEKNL